MTTIDHNELLTPSELAERLKVLSHCKTVLDIAIVHLSDSWIVPLSRALSQPIPAHQTSPATFLVHRDDDSDSLLGITTVV
jgi:hypothetical protein